MTLQRVATAAILIPIVVAAVVWGPVWLVAILVVLVEFLALAEFFALGRQVHMQGYPVWTMLCAAGLVYAQWQAGRVQVWPLAAGERLMKAPDIPILSLELFLPLFVIGLVIVTFLRSQDQKELMASTSVSAAALLLVALPFSYIVRLDGMGQVGPKLLLFLLVLIWVGDTCAYFAGRSLGRLPMAPTLSPKKTWEGAIANVLGSLLTAVVFSRWIEVPPGSLLAGATLTNVAGQLGDLLESAYKRSAGVKDSGSLLPGHGGMLDRIDSLVLAAPVAWWYFSWTLR